MIQLWENWTHQYPIILLEDGLAQTDWEGWRNLTQQLGNNIELVGDDIFCTNKAILSEGIEKFNQLMRIEHQLGKSSVFSGRRAFKNIY